MPTFENMDLVVILGLFLFDHELSPILYFTFLISDPGNAGLGAL